MTLEEIRLRFSCHTKDAEEADVQAKKLFQEAHVTHERKPANHSAGSRKWELQEEALAWERHAHRERVEIQKLMSICFRQGILWEQVVN